LPVAIVADEIYFRDVGTSAHKGNLLLTFFLIFIADCTSKAKKSTGKSASDGLR
jgi:hypothetical protein